VAETREGGNGAPGDGDERDPVGGAELFDDEVGGESGWGWVCQNGLSFWPAGDKGGRLMCMPEGIGNGG
jgi:hypothetical protein